MKHCLQLSIGHKKKGTSLNSKCMLYVSLSAWTLICLGHCTPCSWFFCQTKYSMALIHYLFQYPPGTSIWKDFIFIFIEIKPRSLACILTDYSILLHNFCPSAGCLSVCLLFLLAFSSDGVDVQMIRTTSSQHHLNI